MRLFLASEAKHPDFISKLHSEVGGFKDKKIAYIPTAANGSGWRSWDRPGGTWALVNTLGANVTLVQLEEFWDKDLREALTGKDIIWFAGGMPGYLMYWIRRLELDKYLKELLEEGSVYVGSSAGSMITAPTLDVAEWYIGETEPGVSIIPGLGLVDFDIYPHFEDELFAEIKSKFKGKKLYLIKNGEAVIVKDGLVSILGEERILQN